MENHNGNQNVGNPVQAILFDLDAIMMVGLFGMQLTGFTRHGIRWCQTTRSTERIRSHLRSWKAVLDFR